MAVITPQTDVYLLKCPLEISDINQLTFTNATAQYNYFNSLPKLSVDNFTYQRKDGTIRYGANFDSLQTYNYVMYRNDAYSNKWFYAFITGMEYLNDNVTAISIKTDVWQTYQFDLTFKPVLIDREHTNNDAIGANTYPEGLELGEMVCNGDVTNFGTDSSGVGEWVIVVDVSMIENPGDNQTLKVTTGTPPAQYINGTPSGLYHLLIGVNASVITSARDIIDLYDEAGLGDAIQNVYILPSNLIGTTTAITLSTINVSDPRSVMIYMPNASSGVITMGTYTYNRPSTVSGYIPKNNKLFCYPYNYLNVSNNAGTVIPYRYEDFSGDISFKVEGVLTPSGSIKAIPQNYKYVTSSENAYDFSISGAKYPICGWTTDSYTNWLTQNAVNMTHEWTQSVIQGGWEGLKTTIGTTLATGNPLIGIGAGYASYAGNLIGTALEQHRAKSQANLVADQARGNVNAGDIVWSKLRSRFTFMPMSIKPEYARCIDEFFSQYGYKCNRVKVPNITGRRNWNYVKTVGCYIDADMPQDDLAEIKSMFDKGITLWHNPATFADYSQANDII
jgi:hypothetical protein